MSKSRRKKLSPAELKLPESGIYKLAAKVPGLCV